MNTSSHHCKTTSVPEFIHEALYSSRTWTVCARELSPKSALGENHRIGSKVKFNDFGPFLYWNAIHSGFKRILRCLSQILSETEKKISLYRKNINKLNVDTFYGPPCI
eukprot:GHVL01010762.1.p1 GENE.GHVL01010762.1~~GHVL01010762.1.p1  ORF type:complete len:108 (+),score=1.51 GHVL01010762.1:77-400(+)